MEKKRVLSPCGGVWRGFVYNTINFSSHVSFPCHASYVRKQKKKFPFSCFFLSWGEKQEQTKFYDLRRGITEDFQRLAKFQRTLSKSTKKIHRF